MASNGIKTAYMYKIGVKPVNHKLYSYVSHSSQVATLTAGQAKRSRTAIITPAVPIKAVCEARLCIGAVKAPQPRPIAVPGREAFVLAPDLSLFAAWGYHYNCMETMSLI